MAGPTLERAADAAILATLTWPAWASCTSVSFWRAFPGLAWRLLAGLTLCLIAAGGVSAIAPLWLLRLMVVVALGALVGLHWHARAARGRARHWPPGSLRPLPLGPWFERDFFLDASRRFGSVFKTSQFLRPMACMVGLPEGLAFLKTHEASLASPPMGFGRFIPGGFLRHMPPERHAAAKDVLRRAIAREVYQPFEPVFRDIFRTMAAGIVTEGSLSNGASVPPRRHVQRAMFPLWTTLFFDIEAGTPGVERLKALYRILDIRNPTGASDEAIHGAVAEICRTVTDRLPRDAAAADGAPRSFLEALWRQSPELVDDPSIITNLIYMMHTTWSDMSGLLVWLLRMMTEHETWTARLRDCAAANSHDGASLYARFVMETLRFEQSEHLYRVAAKEIRHNDVVIPSGWLVRVCLRESHQDPAVFDDPARFNPDRFLHRVYSRQEYAPFGGGQKYACLGEGLAALVGRTVVEELSRGFTWRTMTDGPHEYSAWRHWRPSSNWRILVASRP